MANDEFMYFGVDIVGGHTDLISYELLSLRLYFERTCIRLLT